MKEDFIKTKDRFSNFKSKDFRPGQEEAIRFAIIPSKKVRVIVGPTGSGKSLVGMVAGACHKRFSYLCSSKNLQHQLIHDFPEAKYMMGRGNFRCNLDESWTADLCIHTSTTPCRVKGKCYYEVHKRSILSHPIQILNYHYFLHEANYVGGFSDYPIMVCDEADLIEGLLTGFIELRISKSKLDILRLSPPKYKTTTAKDGLNSWRSWAENAKAKVSVKLDSLRRYIESLQPDQELTRDDWQMVGELKTMEALSKKLTIFLKYVDESWLFEETPSGWVFQPTWLKPELSEQYFSRHAERFLFISATMPPRAVLAQMLGVNAGDIDYHEVPSAFPESNRPVFLNPVADLTLKNFKDELPKLVKEIEKILVSTYISKRTYFSGELI
jgi:Rad3-related DNA helicase